MVLTCSIFQEWVFSLNYISLLPTAINGVDMGKDTLTHVMLSFLAFRTWYKHGACLFVNIFNPVTPADEI
jgi:hypothetical protein